MAQEKKTSSYTCREYREEMILNALQKRLQQEDLSSKERRQIEKEIEVLEKKMGLWFS